MEWKHQESQQAGQALKSGTDLTYSENCTELFPHEAGESASVQAWWNKTLLTHKEV